jgi:hypothetical protein
MNIFIHIIYTALLLLSPRFQFPISDTLTVHEGNSLSQNILAASQSLEKIF